ncbi:MAG TPA: alpha-glucan family phosphorylase [Terriglobales bacterium]|nr:alpha-glucan family phosphorylase [Terriglobales bacterium]
MKPIHTFSVVPSLPPQIHGLLAIAHNLRWCWSHESVELFRRLDRDLWETSGHNPVLLLGIIEQEKLELASRDDAFLAHLHRVESNLQGYLASDSTWFHRTNANSGDAPLIAYFSAEFGLTECLSIFAGGLGILAGDHLKSASDLGLPLVGVGLLYQQGYFRQYLNQSGWQQESYAGNDFHNLPVSVVNHGDGTPFIVEVDLAGHPVYAQVWKAQVGRVPLYLLDTNITANQRIEDRDITDQLYGGDRNMRIRQEILLGIGGYRALQMLGLQPTVYHMNEGHSAFLALEHIRHLMRTRDLNFIQARELASASLVFTTHTPVEAGHDYFQSDLVNLYFGDTARELGLPYSEFLNLGRSQQNGDFCMTVLALRTAAWANGVSKLHGEVSRQMWQSLWPGVPVTEIPIRHITNGVHFRSWISSEFNHLYDRYLGPNWREEPANSDVWSRVQSIPAEELWRTHERRRERLVSWARKRVRDQRLRRAAPQSELDAAAEILDPDALTIGFARRFATYKRATLILRDMDRLRRLLTDPARPVQLIFAGKAHPQDDGGKQLIRQITDVSRDPTLGRHVVFLEDYDMAVARYLVQGVDVWLNTPLRPNEASGTSGMKAAANAVLNLSVPDGWWDEVWNDPGNSQKIGWAIGKGESYSDPNYQDKVEAEGLYDLLERDVVPTFYERGADRIPRRWVERMKACVDSLCHFVNTHRMVRDYFQEFYVNAHGRFRSLDADHAHRARDLSSALDRIRNSWQEVWVEKVEDGPINSVPVASSMPVRAQVHLGQLRPEDVVVELYVGAVDMNGDLVEGEAVPMQPEESRSDGTYNYVVNTSIGRSGLHGFTVRVRPNHPDLPVKFIPGLISWAHEPHIAPAAVSVA